MYENYTQNTQIQKENKIKRKRLKLIDEKFCDQNKYFNNIL